MMHISTNYVIFFGEAQAEKIGNSKRYDRKDPEETQTDCCEVARAKSVE
jgi:hypothetical protein